ncbi:hypothetical protein HN789_03235 [archaeon]|jgi:malate permease and related proteins|nr:hypothetical protein [archaeon]MBT4022614.1 hypothetical protein [archaeon]MBT4272054.1 hypothetical protein [archaeon]MBT4461151.1 hypothetical protein [archaeon]MBT4858856.1 hypothetical protein [archaeon]
MELNSLIKSFATIALILIGYFFKKKGHFNHQTIKSINNLVFRLILPAFLFIAFLGVKFETRLIILPVVGFLLAGMLLFIGHILSKILKIKNDYFKFSMTTFEGGMIAYPIFTMLFGVEKIFMVALIDLGNAIFFFTVIMVLLSKHNDKSIKDALLDSAPILIAMFLGLGLNLLGIHTLIQEFFIYKIALETLTLLSIPMVTLIALSIGIDLEFKIKDFIDPIKLIFVRYLFATSFSIILFNLVLVKLGLSTDYKHALMVFALAPSSLLLPALVPDKDRKYLSNLTSLFVPISIGVLLLYGILVT